jgi:hypothetical protein
MLPCYLGGQAEGPGRTKRGLHVRPSAFRCPEPKMYERVNRCDC